ncbi:hypothetical protein DXV75_06165 [Alteromonas aestuariivivens]|uniref:Sulfotransferase family protein n=1 Tax=Alteromonas aestuariivivens TaxID=1938339 RepID=A0A3D8M974_9ALTE|nr:hypothetical protein [Alteromonas aestuariivivens]RDV26577.1 hypothetical protein DXV75_06165 [Alteromonas aestuariivivens]
MEYKKALWAMERFIFPGPYSLTRPNKNLEWISYHIPKTAGSSLRVSLEKSFSSVRVFEAYATTGAGALSKGEQIWIPRKCKVIHGHFRPHANHQVMFPNARRIVWVRDPVARIHSLVRHLLQTQGSHPQYQLIYELYISKGISSVDEIVFDMISNRTLPVLTETYSRFFNYSPISEFEFVGSVHKYKQDLIRLSKLLGRPLQESFKNIRGSMQHIPNHNILKPFLQDEYNIIADYL